MLRTPRGENTRDGRLGSWRRVFANQAKEFCLSTGLHGYKYIAQGHRSGVERTMWAVGVTVSLCAAVALMHIAWEYNASHPTLTVIESTHHGIWNYWFPAVTVCDLNRISLNRTRELVRVLKLPDNETQEDLVAEMRFLNELLDPGIFGQDVSANLTRLQDLFEFNNLTIPDVMHRVTRNCSEIMVKCKWRGDMKPCHSIFESSLTRDGICCSFNYVGVKSREAASNCPRAGDTKPCLKSGFKLLLYMQNDYWLSEDRPTSWRDPRRVTACGYQTGLTALINPAVEDYHATVLGAYGVKVMLHDPYDYPDRNAESKLIGIGAEVFVSVTPVVTYSTEDVRSLPVSKRNCIFPDEWRDLGVSTRRYSYHNCLAICRLRSIFEKCGCVPYYHQDLHSPVTVDQSENDTRRAARICDLKDMDCAYSHRYYYETSWPGENITSGNLPPGITTESSRRPCGCIPDCDFLRYPLESSAGIFDRNNSYQDLEFYDKVLIKNHSVLHIFFSDLVSTQYRRDVYYNWHNLFASFGGLLGLFAGFSLMSGFELIYFFSIRLIADLFVGSRKART